MYGLVRYSVATCAIAVGLLTATPPAMADITRTVIPQNMYTSLIRSDDGRDEAVLQIDTFIPFSGCANFSPIETKIETTPPVMTITLGGFSIVPKQHSTCADGRMSGNQYAYAYIPLDRTMLTQNGITELQFVFRSETNTYALNLNEQRLKLVDIKSDIVKPRGAQTLWYYPPRTVILSTSDIPADANANDLMMNFAEATKLTPLPLDTPALNTGKKQPGDYFFTYSPAHPIIVSSSQPGEIGAITIPLKEKEGFEVTISPDMEPQTVTFYARRPGPND